MVSLLCFIIKFNVCSDIHTAQCRVCPWVSCIWCNHNLVWTPLYRYSHYNAASKGKTHSEGNPIVWRTAAAPDSRGFKHVEILATPESLSSQRLCFNKRNHGPVVTLLPLHMSLGGRGVHLTRFMLYENDSVWNEKKKLTSAQQHL